MGSLLSFTPPTTATLAPHSVLNAARQDLHLSRTMLTGTLPRLCGSFRLRLASTFNHRPDSPAALIIPPFQSVGNMFFLQKIIYVSCFFACHVGSEARENLFCVFFRNYFEFAGSAPYAHKCGVLCFELYFERMTFLPFLFYSPYAGFCKNCIRRHVKPESSSVQVCPKCFRCPRSIRIINPRKSVVKHLGAQNFDNSMKTR